MRWGWYSVLNRVERRTYWACFAGLGLDSMDSTIYALVIPALIATIGLTRPQAGYIATSALVGAAVGGWGGGILADRIGRIGVLQLTIVWVALCTTASAFATGFDFLLVARFLQGLGYGGEAAIGGVLISEVVRPALRGRVAASLQSSYAIGYAISVALLPIISSMFSEEVGWRVFFAVGITPALLVFFIRRHVPESGLFRESRTAAQDPSAPPPWVIFTGLHGRRTAAATIMATGIFGGAYTMITWLPTYLRADLNLTIATSAGYLALNILGSLVGPLLYGSLSDRTGRRPAFMILLVLQATNVCLYLLVPIGPNTTMLLGFFLGAFQGALAAGMLPTFAELFPTRIRASGQGFCLGGGRGFGSVVPATVGLLAASYPLGASMGACALASYGIALLAAFALPETSGTDLHFVAAASANGAAPAAPRPARDRIARRGWL